MRGIFWVGLTGLAAIGGILVKSDDIESWWDGSDRSATQIDAQLDRSLGQMDKRLAELDRLSDEIDDAVNDSNPVYVEQMGALEGAVERGEMSRRDAINLAIRRTVAKAKGEPLPDITDTSSNDAADATARLAQAEAQLSALREEGLLSAEDYGAITARISEARERVSDR
ncbi:hypothetical protein [Sphingomicrobium flavum]|uniref:hypothetical protein n=1 Tax=Sphingomicrobium flavum TaxID=1229164 RepID=UPI0021ADB6CB|nr:hypothetical protein [Sphingomicrobium flavum]